MATIKKKDTATAPKFRGARLLTFKRSEERRDLLGALLDADKEYTFDEVEKRIDEFMKGKVND